MYIFRRFYETLQSPVPNTQHEKERSVQDKGKTFLRVWKEYKITEFYLFLFFSSTVYG